MTNKVSITLPRPHATQMQAITSLARFSVLCCGRRWGKTTLVINLIVKKLLEGKTVAYICPTFGDETATITWSRFKNILADVISKKNESSPRSLELVTGGRLVFWAFTSIDTFRGGAYDFVAIDECAFAPTLETAFHEVIAPTLMDRRGGAIFTSTPKGINGFHSLYMRGLSGMDGWASFSYPTSDNPYISPDEIELARQGMPAITFQQEIEARFISGGGAVFRGVNDVTVLDSPDVPYAGNFVMGVDWGKDTDYTVLSVLDADSKRQVALERFRQVDWSLQRGRLKALADKWGVGVIYAEKNSIGDPNIEALQAEGLNVIPFATTAQSKKQAIEALALAIERRDILLLDDSAQENELIAYTMKKTAAGNYVYSAPAGAHDDMVMALAIAWHGVQNHSGLRMMVLNF